MQLPVTGPAEQVPTRAHDHDAGLDLRAAADIIIPSGARALVPAGIGVAIPAGHVGMVCPRSGLAAKHGVTVLNAPGIIDAGYRSDVGDECRNTPGSANRIMDAGYRGGVGVVLVNHGRAAARINRGDRIAQLVIVPVALPQVVHVDELPPADDGRGTGGFGSTGA